LRIELVFAEIRRLFKRVGSITDGKVESGPNDMIGWIGFSSEKKVTEGELEIHRVDP
jgi:hypothetical protein